MRDVVFFILFVVAFPYCLFHVEWAVALWYWVSLFQPQTQSFSFASSIPFGALSGVAVIIGWLLLPERKLPRWNALTVILLSLGIWTTLTTIFAVDPSASYGNWNIFISLLVMVLAGIVVMNTRERINILLWTISVCIGYYGFKVGLFAVAGGTGESFMGPSYMNGNNELARGALILIPLLFYLLRYWKQPWLRIGTIGVLLGTTAMLILSGSRGAWLGAAAMVAVAAIRIKRGIMWLCIAGVIGVASLPLLPPRIIDRFTSISDFETDESVQGRFAAWDYAFEKFPERPIMGGGFQVFENEHGKASHNSFVQALGEHGSVGLALYLALLVSFGAATFSVIRKTRGHPDLKWASDMAYAFQIVLVGYTVGSLSINEAFFPLFYVIAGLLASVQVVVLKELAEKEGPAQVSGRVVRKRKRAKFSMPAWPPEGAHLENPEP